MFVFRRTVFARWLLPALLISTLGVPPLEPIGMFVSPRPAFAQTMPGGFVEKATSTTIRPIWSQSQLQAFLPPGRGKFTFPAPYNTTGVRLTIPSDCGGTDCVYSVGYSYWRNINNHVGSDTMLIFLGLRGAGPTLFSYNKVTDEVQRLGPLFNPSSTWQAHSGEGWYFSATQPTKLYVSSAGTRLFRYDVLTKAFETVFDVTTFFGSGRYIWQVHSSNDDRVHSATLAESGTYAKLGCMVYKEATQQFLFYPASGSFDECQIDKSGRWLVIKENVDGFYGEDNRIIDLQTGTETLLLDQNGAAGHSDNGYGYMVAEDNWSSLPGGLRLWKFGAPLLGPLVYHAAFWGGGGVGHIAHSNARSDLPPEQQYACGGGATTNVGARANEIVCFRLDTSLDVLVVTQNMTDLNASGGGNEYSKLPKGNVDITGRYFIWASNMGGSRLDAFMVKIPGQLLVGAPSDTTPPTVALTAPLPGATLVGSTTVSANASDNVGVAGVQFKLDGVNLSGEDTAAPYAVSWDTTAAANGAHTLTAVARDAAGNRTTSAPVSVTVSNLDTTAPLISSITVSSVSSSGAGITWTTNEPSNSQVEYGLTTSYGSTTSIDTSLVTAHAVGLSGLAAGTTYHYRVKSRDAAGNLATSSDFTLTTLASSDTTLPTVALTAPLPGDTVSGTVIVTASATDTGGIDWVRFKLDGTSLGPEDTVAPYTFAWDTTTAANGTHTLTAEARDKAGNMATSAPVIVTANNTIQVSTPLIISSVAASSMTSSGATITWTTNEPADSQVEYGVTIGYGSVTSHPAMVTAHTVSLSGLAAGMLYHYRVISKSAAGSQAISDDFTFTTMPAAASEPPQDSESSGSGAASASAPDEGTGTSAGGAGSAPSATQGGGGSAGGAASGPAAGQGSGGPAGFPSAQSASARTPLGAMQSPFKGAAFAIPGTFEAEDFDNGGEGVAYHDRTVGNQGGQYRRGVSVDITSPSTKRYVISSFQTGEWLEYTITVATSGTYRVELLVSSQLATSRFHIEIDGVDRTGPVSVPNTGSWRTFQWVGQSGVALTAGRHILRVYVDEQYFNLDAIRIVTEVGSGPATSIVSARGVPARQETRQPGFDTRAAIRRTLARKEHEPSGDARIG